MKRTLNMLILITLFAALLTACSGGGGSTLEGAQRDQALAYADPLADNLLKGLNDGNYQAFSKDFNKQMLDAIGQTQFDALKKKLDDALGAYQSRSVDRVVDYGKMVTVYYKSVWSKAPNATITLTVTKTEPHQVTGLYFK